MGGTGGAAGAGGAGGTAVIDPDLVLWYPLDEAGGTVANDASGFAGGPRNGTVSTLGIGTATFSTNHQVGTHALDLTGTSPGDGGFVLLPDVIALAPDAITIAVWVNVKSMVRFEKVFSFGVDDNAWMSLSTDAMRTSGPGILEFEITTGGDITPPAERLPIMNGVAMMQLTTGAWHHLAVTLPSGSPYTGTLYLDGAPVGTAVLSIRPSSLGATTLNYLGRSTISTTSFANMILDDFRVYRRALNAAEISALYAVR
jgi:hypothetical protein